MFALALLSIQLGWRRDDPTAGVRKARYSAGDGFRTWPASEVEKFRAHWPEESVARRAFELMREGGLRRSDAVRVGRQHVQGGLLVLRQAKTGEEVAAPITPLLARVLAHTPPGHMLFIPRAGGTPRSPRGFYNTFIAWCRNAGVLPGYGPHGLRKARGNEVADAGGSEWEVAAALGQSSPSSSRPYTRQANRRRLAMSAAAKVAKAQE
jgi:integrase